MIITAINSNSGPNDIGFLTTIEKNKKLRTVSIRFDKRLLERFDSLYLRIAGK